MKFYTKLFLCGMIASLAQVASAQTYNYLTLQQLNGDETSLSLDGLKITFENGNLIATNGSKSATIALADMQKFYFAENETGIKGVEKAADAVSAAIVGGCLHVTAPEGAAVSIYSLDGRRVGTDNLPAGVYVVNVAGRTLKVLAK